MTTNDVKDDTSGAPRPVAPRMSSAPLLDPAPADEEAPAEVVRASSSLPQVGVSLAAVRAFVAEHAGLIFEPAPEERSVPGVQPLPFEALSTEQVVWRVVKPFTAATGVSYAEQLQQTVRRLLTRT